MPQQYRYFNPLPLYRGRPPVIGCNFLPAEFQSTSSIQRKTSISAAVYPDTVFQSTSSIQRKTPSGKHRGGCGGISIHFLYTQEDYALLEPIYFFCISIHFLYTEEDQVKHEQKEFITISIHFLYTEEDVAIRGRIVRQRNFNPLPLYRGRPEAEAGNQGLIGISIHFLYTEEDLLTLL